MNIDHINEAIKQAKLEGNKGVRGFTAKSWEESEKYSKLLNEGKLETFLQEYIYSGFKLSCLLMRKPKK